VELLKTGADAAKFIFTSGNNDDRIIAEIFEYQRVAARILLLRRKT